MSLVIKTVSDSQSAQKDLEKVRRSVDNIDKATKGATEGLAKMAKAIGTITAAGFALRALTQLGDEFTNFENKIKTVTEGLNAQKIATYELKKITLATRGDLQATAALYSKISLNSAELGVNMKFTLDVVQTVNKALQLSGASAAEAAGAVTQLGQAIGSGRLAGDELKSIAENAPLLFKKIAEGLGISVGQMKDAGEQGLITSKKLVKAIKDAQGSIDEAYSKMGITFESAFKTMGNSFKIAKDSISKYFFGSRNVMASWVNDMAQKIGKFGLDFAFHMDGLKYNVLSFYFSIADMVTGAIPMLRELGQRVAEIGTAMYATWAPVAKEMLSAIAASSVALFAALRTQVSELFSLIAGTSIYQQLASTFTKVKLYVVNFFNRAFEGLGIKLPKIDVGNVFKGLEYAKKVVLEWVKIVEHAFFWLYDKVIGNSWIPDLVLGVVKWIKMLLGAPLVMITMFATKSNNLFKGIAKTVGFSMALRTALKYKKTLVGILALLAAVAGLQNKETKDKLSSIKNNPKVFAQNTANKAQELGSKSVMALEKAAKAIKDGFGANGFVRTIKQVLGIRDTTPGTMFGQTIDNGAMVGRGPRRNSAERPLFHDLINALPSQLQVPLVLGISGAVATSIVLAFKSGPVRTAALALFSLTSGATLFRAVDSSLLTKAASDFVNLVLSGLSRGITAAIGGLAIFNPGALLLLVAKLALLFKAGREIVGKAVGGVLTAPTKLVKGLEVKREADLAQKRLRDAQTFQKTAAADAKAMLTAARVAQIGATREALRAARAQNPGISSGLARATVRLGAAGGNVAPGLETQFKRLSETTENLKRAQQYSGIGVQAALTRNRSEMPDLQRNANEAVNRQRELMQNAREGAGNAFAGVGGILGGVTGLQIGEKIASALFKDSAPWVAVGVQMSAGFLGQFFGALAMRGVLAAALWGFSFLGVVTKGFGVGVAVSFGATLAKGFLAAVGARLTMLFAGLVLSAGISMAGSFGAAAATSGMLGTVGGKIAAAWAASAAATSGSIGARIGYMIGTALLSKVGLIVLAFAAVGLILWKFGADLWDIIKELGVKIVEFGSKIKQSIIDGADEFVRKVRELNPFGDGKAEGPTVKSSVSEIESQLSNVGGVLSGQYVRDKVRDYFSTLFSDAAEEKGLRIIQERALNQERMKNERNLSELQMRMAIEKAREKPSSFFDNADNPLFRAEGGWVTGPGGPKDDKIPTMLSNGEFVVNAAAASQNKELLEKLNSGKIFWEAASEEYGIDENNKSQILAAVAGGYLNKKTNTHKLIDGALKPDGEIDLLSRGKLGVDSPSFDSIALSYKYFRDSLFATMDKDLQTAAGSFALGTMGTLSANPVLMTASAASLTDTLINSAIGLYKGYNSDTSREVPKPGVYEPGTIKRKTSELLLKPLGIGESPLFVNPQPVPDEVIKKESPSISKVISEWMLNPEKRLTVLDKLVGIMADGQKPIKRAAGGYVSGPGTRTSDSIKALLSNGEFVVNAEATAKNKPLLEAINGGKGIGRIKSGIPAFSTGGMASADRAFMNSDRGYVGFTVSETLMNKLNDTISQLSKEFPWLGKAFKALMDIFKSPEGAKMPVGGGGGSGNSIDDNKEGQWFDKVYNAAAKTKDAVAAAGVRMKELAGFLQRPSEEGGGGFKGFSVNDLSTVSKDVQDQLAIQASRVADMEARAAKYTSDGQFFLARQAKDAANGFRVTLDSIMARAFVGDAKIIPDDPTRGGQSGKEPAYHTFETVFANINSTFGDILPKLSDFAMLPSELRNELSKTAYDLNKRREELAGKKLGIDKNAPQEVTDALSADVVRLKDETEAAKVDFATRLEAETKKFSFFVSKMTAAGMQVEPALLERATAIERSLLSGIADKLNDENSKFRISTQKGEATQEVVNEHAESVEKLMDKTVEITASISKRLMKHADVISGAVSALDLELNSKEQMALTQVQQQRIKSAGAIADRMQELLKSNELTDDERKTMGEYLEKLKKDVGSEIDVAFKRDPASEAGKAFADSTAQALNSSLVNVLMGKREEGKSVIQSAVKGFLDVFTQSVIQTFVNGLVKDIFKPDGDTMKTIANIGTSIFSFLKFADGGYVSGQGTGRSDSIPAMLSNGEFVVNAKSTKKFAPLLSAINGDSGISKFADGGLVTPAAINRSDIVSSGGNVSNQVINLSVTGDISRQTKAEIYGMIPAIAAGVNTHNHNRGYKG